MSNIKEKIGQRILEARKHKELTRKALAELTDDLKPSRIANWESGLRTPGPSEVKQLAEALDVAPGYLMCLTDDKQIKKTFPWLGALIPLLNPQQACDSKASIEKMKKTSDHAASFIPLIPELSKGLGENAFALHMPDDSMTPELDVDDILIVDPEQTARPGGLVVARLQDNEVVVRRYKQLSAPQSGKAYELIAINNNWANIQVREDNHHQIIGVVLTLIRSTLQ